MAKPERLLNLALANLRRQWPTTLPDFGVAPLTPLADVPLLTAEESMRLGLVRAARRTCDLTPERFTQFLLAPQPRTLVIHAVDAEPGVPLLAFWLLRHADAIRSLAIHLARELECTVLFAIPDDLPDAVRRILGRLGTVRSVDANYPGGYWRLMPRALRLSPTRMLSIDAVLATDWIDAMTTGVASTLRPVALADDSTAGAAFNVVPRGTTVAALAPPAEHEERRWFSGPRLADVPAAAKEAIADGELCFYPEPHGDRSSSACIRCGACIAICPTRCDPVTLLRDQIGEAVAKHPNERNLRRAGIDACIECGLCTAVCPSGIELHHSIQLLRVSREEHAS